MTQLCPHCASPMLSRRKGKFPGEVPQPPGGTGHSCPITGAHQRAVGRMLGSGASPAPFTSPAVALPSRHPGEVGDRPVPLAGCLLSLGVLPRAQPRSQRHRQGFVSASVQCLHFPGMDRGDGTSSVGTLAEQPPPCRRDEPNGLGRRKVPDKRVLTAARAEGSCHHPNANTWRDNAKAQGDQTLPGAR